MKQTTLSVSFEVMPASQDRLAGLIDALHDRRPAVRAADDNDFAFYLRGVPTLHFMALSVFPSPDYDPLFVIEANFDGGAGPFWSQLEAAIGDDLRDMLRCCKRPLDGCGPLYDAATAPGARAAIAPYLEIRASRPSVFHHGNRGLTRARIDAEAKLFDDVRTELGSAGAPGPSPYRATTPEGVHAMLRTAMLPKHGWLAEAAPLRVSTAEKLGDFARLGFFAFVVLFMLAVPGILAAGLMTTRAFVIAVAALAIAVWWLLHNVREPLEGTGTPGKNLIGVIISNPLPILAVLAFFITLATPVVTLATMFALELPFERAWPGALRAVIFGLIAIVALIAPGLVYWLRTLELRDSSHDAPPIDQKVMRQMAQREDWMPQNHMGSIVLLRPGILRTIIVHAGHRGLHLGLRALAKGGYLGSMRTIHFAHWAFVNNSSRLMFFSNFDQSWESYLDDFIEKAHEGLTLAWGCGTGFPATRMLIQDGASHGRLFKAWARHSMAVSRFWYSAYPMLTVDQIERNFRIAEGLRREKLAGADLEAWIDDL